MRERITISMERSVELRRRACGLRTTGDWSRGMSLWRKSERSGGRAGVLQAARLIFDDEVGKRVIFSVHKLSMIPSCFFALSHVSMLLLMVAKCPSIARLTYEVSKQILLRHSAEAIPPNGVLTVQTIAWCDCDDFQCVLRLSVKCEPVH